MFDLKVGFSCNNNCIHCVVGGKRDTRDLSFEEITSIVDDVPDGETIQLTGGEISIRKDFAEIVEYCGARNHKVAIQTNGTGLTEEVIRRIEPYTEHVLIAIHSGSPHIHNLIIRSREDRDMFSRTLQGLRNLWNSEIPFATQTVISKMNMASLHDTFAFIQKECPGILMHLTYPHPLGEAWENRSLVCPSYKDLKEYIQPCFRDFGPFLIVEAIPPCYMFPYYQNVEYNIDANIKKGKDERRGFDPACKDKNDFFTSEGITADYNLNDLDSKRMGPRCKDCFYAKECIGVWREYVDIYRIHFDLFPIKLEEEWKTSLPENCLDIQITEESSSDNILNVLDSNENHSPVIVSIPDSSKNFRKKLAIAKRIAQEAAEYPFPISFLNIPKCYLSKEAKVINTYQPNGYEKNIDVCENCEFESACLGFSDEIPYIEKEWA